MILHEGISGWLPADLVPPLLDVVRGARVLIGVGPLAPPEQGISPGLVRDALAAPYGMFDVETVLLPPDADVTTRLRARAWYAHAKSASVDADLVMRRLRAAA